jgi:hypothetical protein
MRPLVSHIWMFAALMIGPPLADLIGDERLGPPAGSRLVNRITAC